MTAALRIARGRARRWERRNANGVRAYSQHLAAFHAEQGFCRTANNVALTSATTTPTTLADDFRDFDLLPRALQRWLQSHAVMNMSCADILDTLRDCGRGADAEKRLDEWQTEMMARDAREIWHHEGATA